MPEPLIEFNYIEYDGSQQRHVERPVIAETPWILYVDGRELVTFMCSPVRLQALALGFLLSEGIITELSDLWRMKVHMEENQVYQLFPEAGLNELMMVTSCPEAVGTIDVRLSRPMRQRPERRVLTSGCGGGITFDDLSADQPPLTSERRITAAQVTALMRDLDYQASLYRVSRGVHTSALADDQILIVAEDVGRHNTLDKIRGECMLSQFDTENRVLLTSGRISSEMIGKARKMSVPIIISRTSPTAMSVQLARRWNMTLIGYARAPRFRIYAGAERVIFGTSSGSAEVDEEE